MYNALVSLYKMVLSPDELENNNYLPTTAQLWAFYVVVIGFILIGSYLAF
jgi:hypothetical protein